VPEDRKARVFGLMFIIASIGGLGTLPAGPLLDRFGLAATMRFLYGFAFVSMTLMFVIRQRLLTETAAGAELSRRHAELSHGESVRHHLAAVRESLTDPEFWRVALTWVLFSFAQAMGFVGVLLPGQRADADGPGTVADSASGRGDRRCALPPGRAPAVPAARARLSFRHFWRSSRAGRCCWWPYLPITWA